jgi:hypothetical protein
MLHITAITAHSSRLFRQLTLFRLRHEVREAVLKRLAMLIRRMLRKSILNVRYSSLVSQIPHPEGTYAGARVVFRNVDLQTLH